jgi:putative ABC transport system permease protein
MQLLTRWLLHGEWRAHPLRALMAISAIALGIALAFAIHLINAAAFNEFSAAVNSIAGQADLQLRSAQPVFDEDVYPRLLNHPGIALASPVLELDAAVAGQSATLKILATDAMRAAAMSPDLSGMPAPDRLLDTLADDAIFLSPAAMETLHVKTGDTLLLRSGTADVPLRVAGGLVHARAGQRIAVMDIGAAQWRFNRLGKISRIDLKLAAGVNREAFKEALLQEFGTPFLLSETTDLEQRSAEMSRAYRVNLTVLALVALFTGAFLVFSTQALSVIRRRSQFALLRVVGMTRRQLLAQILREGALLGAVGSLLGLLTGYALAATALHFFGGDLGGGYFPGVLPHLPFAPFAASVFFTLGTTVAVLGSAAPALEAARAQPAAALKSGSEDVALARLATPWPGLLCLLLGAGCTQLSPVWNLPVFGYLAVALLLVGAISLMPRFCVWLFSLLSALLTAMPGRANVVATLAVARLTNAPNQASIALGGILSSFSLMVAMAIMVASFRVSVDDWLVHILPADLYVRTAVAGNTGGLNPAEQTQLTATPGLLRTEFLRTMALTLTPGRPPVALIARPIDAHDPGKTLPLVDGSIEVAAPAMPIWVSEAMVDLYGYAVGKTVTLPYGEHGDQQFVVAGIWRDYARQAGSIQIRLDDYRRLSGDLLVTDAALWLADGARAEQVKANMQRLPFGGVLEFAEAGDIRAISLKIFDRSFAVTYLLELVAIVIGLFGVAASFSAQTLARAREFGMLRHLGVTRRQILLVLAGEGGMLTGAGILVGFALGWCISLILVFIVNPQSFHWTMQLHMPWGLLTSVAALLLASASITALLAGRYVVAGDAVRAVREDW